MVARKKFGIGGFVGIFLFFTFFAVAQALPIPVIPDNHSGAFRTPVPIHSGHLFRRIPATPPGGADAGVKRWIFCKSVERFLVVRCLF